jgi:uncharacterized membrane protein YhaH (DUF805 family)
MKGEVLNYDDNAGTGQISGADGIRYSFTRADLKQLVPITRGTRVDFDFEGKAAKDIYIDSPAPAAAAPASPGAAPKPGSAPYTGAIEPDLGLWGYFIRAYTAKFASFSGRARRKEYWGFILFTAIIWVVLTGITIAGVMGDGGPDNMADFAMAATRTPVGIVGLGLTAIFGLASILPSIGVMVRRLHDVGQSGWWALAVIILSAVPRIGFIGSIAILVIALLKGQPGENKYGPPVA